MKWLLVLLSSSCMAQDVLNSGFKVDVFGGVSILDSKLEGEGFAADQGASNGTAYGTNLSYAWPAGNRIHLKYSSAQAKMDTPISILPDNIDANRTELSLYFLTNMREGTHPRQIRLGLGYSILNYKVDDHTPALITEQNSHGLMLIGEKDCQFAEDWTSTLGLGLYMPNNFNEKDVNTGFNPRFLGIEASGQLNWSMKEDLRIFVKAIYRRDSVQFDGTGSRGVTGGKDTRTTITVPVGLSFDF